MGICRSCLNSKRKINCGSVSVHYPSNNMTVRPFHSVTIKDPDPPSRQRSPTKGLHKNSLSEGKLPIGVVTSLTIEAIPSSKPTPEISKKLLNSLQNHPMLKFLDAESLSEIVQKMKEHQVGPRTTIYSQGDSPMHFFVMSKGRVERSIDGIKQEVIEPFGWFGDYSLLNSAHRMDTIKTIERTFLWVLDKCDFEMGISTVNGAFYEENLLFLNQIPLLNFLKDSERFQIVQSLNMFKWEDNEVIFQKGGKGNTVFLIKEGEVVCSSKSKEINKLTQGEIFGECAILNDLIRMYTARAAGTVVAISIPAELFGSAVDNIEQISRKNIMEVAIEESHYLKDLDFENRLKLVNSAVVERYYHGDIVISCDAIRGEYFWVVVKGKILGKEIVDTGKCVGDKYLAMPLGKSFGQSFTSINTSDVAKISRRVLERASPIKQVSESDKLFKILKSLNIFKSVSTRKLSLLTKHIEEQQYPASS